MRALILQDYRELTVGEVGDARPPETGEVRLRISYTGICGSDVHGYTGENGRRVPGQVMGHESVGRVDALGPGAEERGLRVGQVVTFNPLISCGRCARCRAGVEQHCPHRVVIGVDPTLVSAFAERLTLPAANVVPLGDGVDERHGALVEPLAVALHAARRAGVSPGDTVLVTGGGPIGQSVVLAALRLGAARVLCTDVSPGRRALCERLGATPIDPSLGAVAAQVHEALGGPADVAIDAVGIAPTLADALESTALGATVCLVGMGAPQVELAAYRVSTEERTVVGSFCYPGQTFRDAAAWVSSGEGPYDELISAVVPMHDAGAAFDRLAGPDATDGKILVDLGER